MYEMLQHLRQSPAVTARHLPDSCVQNKRLRLQMQAIFENLNVKKRGIQTP